MFSFCVIDIDEMESDERILINNVNDPRSYGNKLRKYKLEPALLFLFFGYDLSLMIVPNQLLKQTCLSYGYNISDCSKLNEGGDETTKKIEESIQPLVAKIIMTSTLLNSIIPAIVSLFLGPWSDKYGRKKVISAACIGFSLTLFLFSVLSMMCNQAVIIDPWIFVVPTIPMILTGGRPSLIVSVLCYVTDLTDESERSSRLVLIELIIFIGMFFGIASCSYLLAITSATTVFIISTTCVTLSTIYIIVFVDESVEVMENDTCGQIKELMSPTPIRTMINTCCRKRPFNETKILFCLVFILMLSIFVLNGSRNVFYLFVREKFNWKLKDAAQLEAFTHLITIIGGFLGICVLKKLLKFSDLSLAFIAIISTIIDSLLRAFAQNSSLLYIASTICLFEILLAPMCRSLISNIIPASEIGEVYSLISSFEAVSNLFASPLYTFIYAKTFTSMTGSYNFITTFMYIICLILALWVMRMRKEKQNFIKSYSVIQ